MIYLDLILYNFYVDIYIFSYLSNGINVIDIIVFFKFNIILL